MKPSSLVDLPHLLITMEIDTPISREGWEAFCASVGLHLAGTQRDIRTYRFAQGMAGTTVSICDRGVDIRATRRFASGLTGAVLLRAAIEARWPFTRVRAGFVERKIVIPKVPDDLRTLLRDSIGPVTPVTVHQGRWVETPGQPASRPDPITGTHADGHSASAATDRTEPRRHE